MISPENASADQISPRDTNLLGLFAVSASILTRLVILPFRLSPINAGHEHEDISNLNMSIVFILAGKVVI
jgi:hypothetical protein